MTCYTLDEVEVLLKLHGIFIDRENSTTSNSTRVKAILNEYPTATEILHCRYDWQMFYIANCGEGVAIIDWGSFVDDAAIVLSELLGISFARIEKSQLLRFVRTPALEI